MFRPRTADQEKEKFITEQFKAMKVREEDRAFLYGVESASHTRSTGQQRIKDFILVFS